MSGKLWFLSFANKDLGKRIRNPRERIRRQAEAMGVFGDRIRVWTEDDLDPEFKEKFKSKLISGTRGYGYWCWKPQVVLQILQEMDEGDVVLYNDIGCHLNPGGIARLWDYYNLALEYGIVAFQARSLAEDSAKNLKEHFLIEKEWTKGDLLDYFGARDNLDIINSGQFGSGIFLIRKSDFAQLFFEEFLQVYSDRYELCTDSPSISDNYPGFIENRHDQSVFSILGKKAELYTLSSCEYHLITRGDDWRCMAKYPIWAKHDKGGIRSLFPNWFKRIVHKLTNN
jgi:hypothetical protein